MNGKVKIAFSLLLVFMVATFTGALAANQEQTDISGEYTYSFGDEDQGGGGQITITKSGADEYFADISAGTFGFGGGGTKLCRFYGSGKVSGDFLLISNTVTHEGKSIPATLKIYLAANSKLDSYAKEHNRPEYSNLQPGQIAIIDEGELPPSIRDLDGSLGGVLLPGGEDMFWGWCSFDGVYTKEQDVAAVSSVAQQTTPQPPSVPAQEPPPVSDAPPASVKPSFDCAKATTSVELAICADSDLAELDLAMANIYKPALKVGDKNTIVPEQRQWLKQMNNQCADVPDAKLCIQLQYATRLEQLGQYIRQAANPQ
jgi:uncharacterized protein YecT (DUF1311 family)